MAAYAEGLNVLAKADIGAEDHAADAETAPLDAPAVLPVRPRPRRVTEVWRRGSVVASWLLDLTADALAADPAARRRTPAAVSDSGEGRWTIARRHRRGRAGARCCRPRCSSGSARVAAPTSPTRCCRRCAPGSAATYETNGHDPMTADASARPGSTPTSRRRRPRAVRRHRRPRQAQAVPGAVPPGAPRRAEGPGDRRRPQRLDRRRRSASTPSESIVASTSTTPTRPVIDALCERLDLDPGRLLRRRRRGRRCATRSTSTSREIAVFYMAIPPTMFPTVAESLASVGLNERGRIVVEKPFGRDLAVGARAQRHAARGLPRGAHLPHRPLPRQGERRGPARVPLLQHAARAGVEPQLRAQRADHDGGDDRRRGPGQLLRRRRRDPRRAAEPPAAGRVRCWRWSRRSAPTRATCRTRRPRCSPPCEPIDSDSARARPVRRLPRRARRRPGLARPRRSSPPRCEIDSWRWAGVPWYVRVRQGARRRPPPRRSSSCATPPRMLFDEAGGPTPERNLIRFRLGKRDGVTFTLQAKTPGPAPRQPGRRRRRRLRRRARRAPGGVRAAARRRHRRLAAALRPRGRRRADVAHRRAGPHPVRPERLQPGAPLRRRVVGTQASRLAAAPRRPLVPPAGVTASSYTPAVTEASEAPLEDPRPDDLRRAPSVVVLNTGDGKGKSSAAFGVMIRAVARAGRWRWCSS